MKIEQLQYFVALEKYRKFSSAAESLYISQSSLSKQLKNLENELSVDLFIRNTRNVELSEAGQRILEPAKRILKEYSEMLSELNAYTNVTQSKIRICALCEMSQYGITGMIIDFEKNQSTIYAQSKERDHQSMLNCLDTRDSDIAIGFRELWPESSDYISYPLEEDCLVIVMSSKHSLAKRESIDLSEAANEKFCFPREDVAMFQFFVSQCKEAGFSPDITFSDVRMDTIRHYVAQGMRVTILTKKRAEEFFNGPQYAIVPFNNSAQLTLSIYTRNEPLPLIYRQFIQHASDYYGHEI